MQAYWKRYFSPAYGLGNAGVRTNKDQVGAAPTVTAANNGLSLSGTTAQLGQTWGAVGDPALIINNREIPMDLNVQFKMVDFYGVECFLLSDATTILKAGQPPAGLSSGLVISGATQQIFFEAGNNFLFSDPNTGDDVLQLNHQIGLYQIGDISNTSSGLTLDIDDGGDYITLGDINGIGNRIFLFLNNGGEAASIRKGSDNFLNLDIASGLYQIGDIDTAGNGTNLSINDTNEIVTISSGGNDYFTLDGPGENFYLFVGDPAFIAQESELGLGSGVVSIYAQDDATHGAAIHVQGAGKRIQFNADNGLYINNTDGILLHFLASLGNGAGAGAGTITNAPAAGNPTKWIPIDDNGTTRHIPAW